MKERPILFSAPMVRALLEGRKTQTRRVIKPQPKIDESGNFCWNGWNYGQNFDGPLIQAIASPIPSSRTKRVLCPYGKPGDRLWVRETWALTGRCADARVADYQIPEVSLIDNLIFFADADAYDVSTQSWRASIHMPRWASRINLEITGIRVERLTDISEEGAMAEGAKKFDDLPSIHPYGQDSRWSMEAPTSTDECLGSARMAFANFWIKINGEESWSATPWVWVIELKRITA
jgi:hypothetical protein